MTKQNKLIGTHPISPNIFGKWLTSTDHPDTISQCYRELNEITPLDEAELINWLSDKIIQYHYSEDRIIRLKKRYSSLGFNEYALQNRMIPTLDDVKKGNATEIILFEYIIQSTKKPLIKTYKFRYNSNVNQSMKGDDMIMVDYDKGKNDIKVYFGEAKFRQSPDKTVIDDISKSLSTDKDPISYSFLVNRLLESKDTLEIGNKLDQFIIEKVKNSGKVTYAGLLLSNKNTSKNVQRSLNSDNPNLVFISIGIDNPSGLIKKAFEKAEEKLSNPKSL